MPLAILAALFAVAISQTVYFYPRLPNVVISHTGPDGPDGWMGKGTYLAIMLGMEVALALLIAVLPLTIGRRTNRINIPNASYWLASARRESTLEAIGRQMLWLAVIVQAGNLLIWQFTLEENLGGEHLVPISFLGLIGLTFAASAIWLIVFARRFARSR